MQKKKINIWWKSRPDRFLSMILCMAGGTVFSSAQFTALWPSPQTNNPSAGTDRIYAVAVDAGGIYVAGYDAVPGIFNPQWRIEKRDLTTGALIPAFGTAGVVTSNSSAGDDIIKAITVDGSGIYVAGYDYSLGNYQWRIEKRNLTTGALIAAFGTAGVVTSNPSAGSDILNAVAADAGGIYAAGYDDSQGPFNEQWRIEKRNLTTGALIWSKVSNPSTNNDYAYAVATSAGGVYVAGYDNNTGGNWQWRIEKRSLTTGNLVVSFGTSGVVTSDPSANPDYAHAVTVSAGGIYVAGMDNAPGDDQWRIEKRDLTTGSLIAAFGTAGVVTSNPSTGNDFLEAITADATGIYAAGTDYAPGSYQWRIEKRDLTTGALLCEQTDDPSGIDDIVYAITADATGIYAAGGDYIPGNNQWRMEKYNFCPALSAELVYFRASPENDALVKCEWQTATETNNDYFSVERSADGVEFTGIGRVKGAGNSFAARTYEFVDQLPPLSGERPSAKSETSPTGGGVNYYRLKQIGYDGRFTYSQTVSVTTGNGQPPTRIYMSPTGKELNCELSFEKNGMACISIFNMPGNTVLNEQIKVVKGTNNLKLDIGDLSEGMYFLSVDNGNNISMIKFIKN